MMKKFSNFFFYLTLVVIIGSLPVYPMMESNEKKIEISCENEIPIDILAKAKEGEPEAQFEIGRRYDLLKKYKLAFEWFEKSAMQNNPKAQHSLGVMYKEGKGVDKNEKKALELYEKCLAGLLNLSQKEDPIAQAKLGWLYFEGQVIKKDERKAFEWWEKSALQGYVHAQMNVAWAYTNSKGVERDNKKAFEWYQKAALQGFAGGQYGLGVMYANDEGGVKDDKEAFQWYKKAAEQRHTDAQYAVGWSYKYGKGVAKDEEKAFEWYKKAALQGHAEAQYIVGWSYKYGKGIAINNKEAFEWCLKAANQEHVNAQFLVGTMYQARVGIPQEEFSKATELAVYWLKKASLQGDVQAQTSLGAMYKTKRGISSEELPNADYYAFEWFQKAAEQGGIKAQILLGAQYQEKLGIPKEEVGQAEQLAIYWYKKAALQGDPLAQVALASMYEKKQGISEEEFPKANYLAFEWYNKAALQGNASAQYNLGTMYREKRGILKEELPSADFLAVEWFQKAALKGHALAQTNLAAAYANKSGISEVEIPNADYLAVEWYKKAATQGHALAQHNLGYMYLEKRGIPEKELPNADRLAVEWYQKAALQGNAHAQHSLGLLYKLKHRISKEEILDCDELAVKWLKKAALQGYAQAQHNLAAMYYEKRGISEEELFHADELALQWHQKAASQEKISSPHEFGILIDSKWEKIHTDTTLASQSNLGNMYYEKRGISDDDVSDPDILAFEWSKKAALGGVPTAQNDLGRLYSSKRGIPEEDLPNADSLAVEWFKKAALQGLAIGQSNLGLMYYEKKGVFEKELHQADQLAFHWFQEAASQGLATAQNSLGMMYVERRAVPKEELPQADQLAFHWFQKAALQGEDFAQVSLCTMYSEKKGIPDEEFNHADKLAIYWAKKAAMQGNARAMYNLGNFYTKRKGISEEELPHADELALQWYKKAAYQEEPHAQLRLGLEFSKSSNYFKNNTEAAYWLIKAAKAGDRSIQRMAQKQLGYMYLLGLGVLKNRKKAYALLHASTNHQDLQHLVFWDKENDNGKTNFSAISTFLNEKEAFAEFEDKAIISLLENMSLINHTKTICETLEEYEFAALAGLSEDQLHFGVMHHFGIGISQDRTRAIEWYAEAAQRGCGDAQYIFSKMGKSNDANHTWLSRAFAKQSELKHFSSLVMDDTISNNIDKALFDRSSAVNVSLSNRDSLVDKFLKHYATHAQPDHKDSCDILVKSFSSLIMEDIVSSSINESPLSLSPSDNFSLSIADTAEDSAKLEKFLKHHAECAQKRDEESRDILIALFHDNNKNAASLLGKLYADISIERPITTTDQDVAQWFQEASESYQDPVALYRLGRMFEYGWGVTQDPILMVGCFLEAAQDHWYAPAQKALAEMYLKGKGIEQSNPDAIRWYRRAAKQADQGACAMIQELAEEKCIPEAIYSLAQAHKEGWGIAQDEEVANIQYMEAANYNYDKAKYIVAIKNLEGKLETQENVNSLKWLTELSGKEARKNYLNFSGIELDRKARNLLKKLSKEGYYRAQCKLAELYALGRVLPFDTIEIQITAYQEAIRLYEIAKESIRRKKLVSLEPIERIRKVLNQLQQMSDNDKFEYNYPGFFAFIKKYNSGETLDYDFKLDLALLFKKSQSFEEENRNAIQKIIGKLLRFSVNRKAAWGILAMLKNVLKENDQIPNVITISNQAYSHQFIKKELSVLSEKMDLLNPLWCFIPPAGNATLGNLKVIESMLRDPRIEIFNTCFWMFEKESYNDIFEVSVEKVLTIFDKLNQERIGEDLGKDVSLVRHNLSRLLTHDNKATHRFKNRLVKIADIIQEKFEEGKSKRAIDILTSLKTTLLIWAERGAGDCLTGGEEELGKFYLNYILDNQGGKAAALTKEDWSLEIQVAVMLANLRLQLLDELVEEKDNDRIHALMHLRKKARVALGLLGDAENYVDGLGKTIFPKYLSLSAQDIVNAIQSNYTPEKMISYIIDHATQSKKKKTEKDYGNSDEYKDAIYHDIFYTKLLRRLQFQALKEKVDSKGKWDKTFFYDEDYILDKCTQHEFEKHKLHKDNLNSNSEITLSSYQDWETLKGQSYQEARKQIEELYYDDNYKLTPIGAKALLRGMRYLEEEEL